MLDKSRTERDTRTATGGAGSLDAATLLAETLHQVWTRRADELGSVADHHRDERTDDVQRIVDGARAAQASGGPLGLFLAWQGWAIDSAQRRILFMDTLRERGDDFLEHEAAGAPPVLIYDYDLIVDGADLPRPCNYTLLEIKPPDGVTIDATKRPFIIIDPRAGHGAGIGGFKEDSQVGVALKNGQPVYFVAFRPMPEPGQTIADVIDAEAMFVRTVRTRHPDSPKPIIIGNCQGGWATAILAATHPELTGPIVLSGAPMSYWSGTVGQDPMRYGGGLAGGALPALLTADLGGGLFDGAYLVDNFEKLSPGNTRFRKYFDLYAKGDKGRERFLDFERWWGGLHLMNGEEMRWIVENLFVGNKLAAGEAMLAPGRPIDLKAIKAPVIVFASRGDNITPPPQALNWIVDTYTDECEIEIRGQRIIYMVHEEVGHLGIFVSSKIATREHTEIASILETIEALPPGLYELIIEDVVGTGQEKRFKVSFARRTLADVAAFDDTRADEASFAAVARASETLVDLYESTARPLVQAMVTKPVADAGRALHPMRLQRSALSSMNPWMNWLPQAADRVRGNRRAVAADNPFLVAEKAWADAIETAMDGWRDMGDLVNETAFFSLWATPFAAWYGAPRQRTRAREPAERLRYLPEVVEALEKVDQGAYPEGLIRMLLLIAATRVGGVRRSRLERSASLLTTQEPFASMDPQARTRLIHEQSLIVRYRAEEAFDTLPGLFATKRESRKALDNVRWVVGDEGEMEQSTRVRLDELKGLLGVT